MLKRKKREKMLYFPFESTFKNVDNASSIKFLKSGLSTEMKWKVHTKMIILSSITYPHVVPNLYKFPSVEHNRRYFKYLDFHSTKILEVNGHQQLFGYTHSLKYLFLCV